MKVPLLELQAQYVPICGDVLAAIPRVHDNQFIIGPEVERLERHLASAIVEDTAPVQPAAYKRRAARGAAAGAEARA